MMTTEKSDGEVESALTIDRDDNLLSSADEENDDQDNSCFNSNPGTLDNVAGISHEAVSIMDPDNSQNAMDQSVGEESESAVQITIPEGTTIEDLNLSDLGTTTALIENPEGGEPLQIVMQNSSGHPLGSSENPIQIIQQGNTYHSTQVLTQEQLKQIASVLQQQHILQQQTAESESANEKPSEEAESTSISYKVVYPSEVKRTPQTSTPVSGLIPRRRPGRPPKRTNLDNEDPDAKRLKLDDNSDHDFEESLSAGRLIKWKKRQTRSGRISKPSPFMVREYKNIMKKRNRDSEPEVEPMHTSDDEELITTKTQEEYIGTNQCRYCKKAYIGPRGLERHHRLYPDHINMTPPRELPKKGKRGRKPYKHLQGNMESVANNVDSESEDSFEEVDSDLEYIKTTDSLGKRKPGRMRSVDKRKADFDLLLKDSTDLEMRSLIRNSRLLNCMSVWEYMVLRCSNKADSVTSIAAQVCYQLQSVLKHARNLLSLETLGAHVADGLGKQDLECDILQLEDRQITSVLGLETGTYIVKERPFRNNLQFALTLINNASQPRATATSNKPKTPLNGLANGSLRKETPRQLSKVPFPFVTKPRPSDPFEFTETDEEEETSAVWPEDDGSVVVLNENTGGLELHTKEGAVESLEDEKELEPVVFDENTGGFVQRDEYEVIKEREEKYSDVIRAERAETLRLKLAELERLREEREAAMAAREAEELQRQLEAVDQQEDTDDGEPGDNSDIAIEIGKGETLFVDGQEVRFISDDSKLVEDGDKLFLDGQEVRFYDDETQSEVTLVPKEVAEALDGDGFVDDTESEEGVLTVAGQEPEAAELDMMAVDDLVTVGENGEVVVNEEIMAKLATIGDVVLIQNEDGTFTVQLNKHEEMDS